MRDKNIFDSILLKYKAQPLGFRNREYIVKREFIEDFVMDILTEGFDIIATCWWEYCKTLDSKNQLGMDQSMEMGGLKSIYYDGWFSEIIFTDDYPCKVNLIGKPKDKSKIVMDHIKDIRINESVTFENTETLTPSFIIDVPNDWYNIPKK